MIARLLISSSIALLPATAIAQSLTDTHEAVSVPGKTVVAYRPIAQNNVATAKCHPDGTKAIACEAVAHRARTEALAARKASEAVRLGSR